MSTKKSTTVLIQAPDTELDAETIERIVQRNPGELIHLAPEAHALSTHHYPHWGDAVAFESALQSACGTITVILAGFAPSDRIPSPWINSLAARQIAAIKRVAISDGTLNFHPHRPMAEHCARVLSIFPGPMIPTTMGSHQRAFQLVAAAAEKGIYIDTLISGNREALQSAKAILSQVSPRTTTFKSSKNRLPLWMRARRVIEKRLRKAAGYPTTPPDLFSERLNNKATFSGKKNLRNLLDSGQYTHVIINYAWMEPMRALLSEHNLRSVSWICDTHDVQYVRNETANDGELRFMVKPEREKQLELDVLDKFEKIVAISPSDADVLRTSFSPGKVILAPTGFDYAVTEPREVDPEAPVFGFIGGKMDANVLALKKIINDWWPAISQRWPKAKLRVGGAVTTHPQIQSLLFLRNDICNDGYVDSLVGWYASIDALLNPVVVKGGLNFKSVEALMAGRLLVTTPMGAQCLGSSGLAAVADTAAEAVKVLAAELFAPGDYVASRIAVQRRAQETFSSDAAYQGLLAHLAQPRQARPQPEAPRAMRVLIQCGDHFENRTRILALAQAVRDRGHHPIVLVYSNDHIAPFLAQGIDAIALYDFNESQAAKLARGARIRGIKRLSHRYRDFDLDDICVIDQIQNPSRYSAEKLPATIDMVTREIDRMYRVLEHVEPDQLYVWNGFTGFAANILRQHAKNASLPTLFLERSIFKDGVFVDPKGTNGSAEIAQLTKEEVEWMDAPTSPRQPLEVTPEITEDDATALRSSGPWSEATRLVFVPLQVQTDTNIILHSPDFKTMAAFVRAVKDRFGEPGTAIIVRPHPEEVIKDLKLPKLEGVFVNASGGLDTWLHLADLVVTINSTVGLQALLRGKPVISYGNSIFGRKGLTTGETPDPLRMERYWNVLTGRYTCLPEHPAQVLEDLLPVVAPAPCTPRNPFNLDPRNCHAVAKASLHSMRERALAAGVLNLAFDLTPADMLNLTYRKTKEPVSSEFLEQRARELFDLPEDFPVRIRPTESQGTGMPFITRKYAPQHNALSFDRYLWQLPVQNPARLANTQSTVQTQAKELEPA